MTDFVDEIAQELANRFSDNPYYLDNAAQAIRDLIIDRIPPLVWMEGAVGYCFANNPLTDSKLDVYRAHPHRDGRGFLSYHGSFKTDALPTIEAAKAAANAHHVAQLCKGMGIEYDQ